MSQVIHTSETAFENDVLKSNVPVVVDFWAEWCGPCRVIAPIVEELSKEYNGKVQFAKVNVDESPDLAGRFGVQGIPTLIIFKDGEEVGRLVGAAPQKPFSSRDRKNPLIHQCDRSYLPDSGDVGLTTSIPTLTCETLISPSGDGSRSSRS